MLMFTKNIVTDERRRRNQQLVETIEKGIELKNAEDLVRLVGHLTAIEDHIAAALSGDGDIFCLLKHCSATIILSQEVDGNTDEVWRIMTNLTDGKIQPCDSCKKESNVVQKDIEGEDTNG